MIMFFRCHLWWPSRSRGIDIHRSPLSCHALPCLAAAAHQGRVQKWRCREIPSGLSRMSRFFRLLPLRQPVAAGRVPVRTLAGVVTPVRDRGQKVRSNALTGIGSASRRSSCQRWPCVRSVDTAKPPFLEGACTGGTDAPSLSALNSACQ